MSKRHEINLLTSASGKTWASCATCGAKSKQGTKDKAEEWQMMHWRLTEKP